MKLNKVFFLIMQQIPFFERIERELHRYFDIES